MEAQPQRLRSNALWLEAYVITEYVYSQIELILENHPEEKWATASKLRTAANDGMFFISKAIAGTLPEPNLYDWDQARRHYFSLQAMYLIAGKQHFIEIDPDIIVKLDSLLGTIMTKIAAAKTDIATQTDKDFKSWLKKYEIWQKIKG